jgi:maltose O-acetyltransferase
MKKAVKILFLFLINTFLSSTHFFSIKRFLLKLCGYKIGVGTKIVGPIYIGRNAELSVGDYCWIGKKFTIHGHGKVCIGNKCDLAPEILLVTGSHEVGEKDRRAGNGISFSISIGNGCWIGVRSTIMGNISIGEGTIVGSCALVNKDIEENMLVGGIPARKLRQL